MIARRSFLVALFTLAVACKKSDSRCEHCGMKIDPTSAFSAELAFADGATKKFDTTRCALSERLTLSNKPTLRVQEFYGRTWTDGTNVRFINGSDVVGPMGPEIVPVDP